MLVNPIIRIHKEADMVVLEVEDEGAAIKVNITEKVLEVLDEINNG